MSRRRLCDSLNLAYQKADLAKSDFLNISLLDGLRAVSRKLAKPSSEFFYLKSIANRITRDSHIFIVKSQIEFHYW